jgi:hypothetical protein
MSSIDRPWWSAPARRIQIAAVFVIALALAGLVSRFW